MTGAGADLNLWTPHIVHSIIPQKVAQKKRNFPASAPLFLQNIHFRFLVFIRPVCYITIKVWIYPPEEGFALKLNNKKGNKNNGKKGSPNIMGIVSLVVWALIITVLLNYFFSFASTANTVEVKFSEFVSLVKEDKVEEVKLENSKYTFTLKKDAQQVGSPSTTQMTRR